MSRPVEIAAIASHNGNRQSIYNTVRYHLLLAKQYVAPVRTAAGQQALIREWPGLAARPKLLDGQLEVLRNYTKAQNKRNERARAAEEQRRIDEEIRQAAERARARKAADFQRRSESAKKAAETRRARANPFLNLPTTAARTRVVQQPFSNSAGKRISFAEAKRSGFDNIRIHASSAEELVKIVKGMAKSGTFRNYRLYFQDQEVPRLVYGWTPVLLRAASAEVLKNAILKMIKSAMSTSHGEQSGKAFEGEYTAITPERVLSKVTIRTSSSSGGCRKETTERHVLELANGVKADVFSPSSRDNNCGINIFRHFDSNLPSALSIRKMLGVKSGAEITTEQMYKIAEMVKLRLLIIDAELRDVRTGESISKDNILDGGYQLTIVLYQNHYYQFLRFNSSEQKYCPDCARSYVKAHVCKATRVEHVKLQREFKKNGKQDDTREIVYFTADLETRPDYENANYVGTTPFYRHHATLAALCYEQNGVLSTEHFLGLDCITRMLEAIKAKLNDRQRAVVHFHNGSKFDHYFVLDVVMDDPKFDINYSVIKGSRLLSLNYDFGKIICLDSCNLFTDSLDSLCKAFKVQQKKLKAIEVDGKEMGTMAICLMNKHQNPQQWADWLQTPEGESFRTAYITYCEMDCVSLYELLTIAAKQVDGLANSVVSKVEMNAEKSKYIRSRINLRTAITLSGFSDKLFKDLNKTVKARKNGEVIVKSTFWEPSDEDPELLELISASKCGGISEVFQPGIHTGKKGENVACFDVVSLYASVMEHCEFPDPTEKPNLTTEYVPGKFGVYLCRNIKQATKHIMDYPATANGARDWKQPELAEATLTSIDMERMWKHGSTFEVINGCYWERKTTPFKDIVGAYNAEKMNQDALKKAKSPEYNEALRTASKFMSNSLFGRQLMEIETSEYVKLESCEDVNHEKATELLISKGQLVAKLAAGKKYGTIQLGTFILAHSRHLMQTYFDMVGRENVIATETDSIYTTVRAGQRLYDAGVVKKELGLLECEFDDCELAMFTGKKQYFVKNANEGGKLITKMKCKGVPKKSSNDIATEDFIHLSQIVYEDILYRGESIVNDILVFKRNLLTNAGSYLSIGRERKYLKADSKLTYQKYFHSLESSTMELLVR